MPDQMQNLLLQYVKEVQRIYGRELKSVILYGSNARGDFHASSDIDIMILVNADESVIKEKGRMLSDITFDFNLDHDMLIMAIVKNISHFQYWLQANPFYQNIKKEGIELYVA